MSVQIMNMLESIFDFSAVLNASIAASWLILIVLLFRFLLKKAPKWSHVMLWGLVALRLLIPFPLESRFSLIPSAETIPGELLRAEGARLHQPMQLEIISNPVYSGGFSSKLNQSVDQIQISMVLFTGIWILGICIMLLYTLISYLRLHRKLRTAIRFQGNIYQSEQIGVPFVLGFFRPQIYLPFSLEKETFAYVIAHEQAHIRRRDYWWKLLGFILLAVHWFNPLMWLSYILLCRDIELACDEKVIRKLDERQRADYSQSLLSCSVNRKRIAACPLAFGEVGVKERVRAVLNYQKPTFWIVGIIILVCIVAAAGFLTNPKEEFDLSEKGGSESLEEAAYYMELSYPEMKFRDMEAERREVLLAEYEGLLEGYTFFARESEDGTCAYILGIFFGETSENPLYLMNNVEVGDYSGDTVQILYGEEDAQKVDSALAEGTIPEAGVKIQNSTILFMADDFRSSPLILIAPKDAESVPIVAYNRYLMTPDGAAYIEDAVARGIDINGRKDPCLYVYRLDERFGEIAERIPLTEEEARKIEQEQPVKIASGCGFSASLHRNGNTIYYSESTDVPQSVIDLAVEHCHYRFESTDDIPEHIMEAKLEGYWLEEPRYAKEGDLERLIEIMRNAEFGYVGGCGYGARVTLTSQDGEKFVFFKGTDGCDTVVLGSYGGYFIGQEENLEFWNMFGLDPETKEPVD